MPLVKKASGEMQPFSADKLISSLRRSGAGEEVIGEIVDDIAGWVDDGMSTGKIYARAFMLLRKKKHSIAARYSLKKAMMELGPSGYPFEFFVGEVFRYMGFEVEVGQEVDGHCVKHEVDVIATGNKSQHLVECKFYNSPGKNASVQVPLYIRSRVDDIIRKRKSFPEFKDTEFHGWIVTNTRFTTDAISFGECAGLNLLSWDYPASKCLRQFVEEARVFPVTALTSLTKGEKENLLASELVLCRQLLEKPEALDAFGFTPAKKQKVLKEAGDLCSVVLP